MAGCPTSYSIRCRTRCASPGGSSARPRRSLYEAWMQPASWRSAAARPLLPPPLPREGDAASVPGDLGEALGTAPEAPEPLDDDPVQLSLGTVLVREAVGLGAALHLHEITLAGKADVAVDQRVAVQTTTRCQVVLPFSCAARERTR
jgi:hypothetical protein